MSDNQQKNGLENIMLGEEDRDAKKRFSYIILGIVGVIVAAVLAITIWKSIDQPVTPEKMALNREDFATSYDASLAKEKSVKFRKSAFEGNTFVIGVEINRAAFTHADVVGPKWLIEKGQEKNARAMCAEAGKIIKNRYIGAQAVAYRYYYDNTMQYAIRLTEENCSEVK